MRSFAKVKKHKRKKRYYIIKTEKILLNAMIENGGVLDIQRLIEYIESYSEISGKDHWNIVEEVMEFIEEIDGSKNDFNHLMFGVLSSIVNYLVNEFDEDFDNFETYVNGLDSWITYSGKNKEVSKIVEEL